MSAVNGTSLAMELGGPLAIRTKGLAKRFGKKDALAGVDLTVPEGSVYVLVGPNGAGKTTTMEVLLDVVVADAGTAEVLGLDSHENGAEVRARIGWVPEKGDPAYGWMRVGDRVRHHAAFHRAWDETYAAELARLFEIRPEARLDRLSKGEQRRVQLLLALAHHPPVVLLDEPTDGLDPVMRERTHSALAAHLARFPSTMLISTHHVNEAERLGEHLGVMRAGRIEAQLDRETLRRRLRSYRLQVPDGWAGAPALAESVVLRNGSAREVAWTIWGEEAEIAERLRATGATIREVEPLSLEDAALALLSRNA
jgi:ABC-2 type transport system ATP-binding protein